MSPPPWTSDKNRIELLSPPVCNRCRWPVSPSVSRESSLEIGKGSLNSAASRKKRHRAHSETNGKIQANPKKSAGGLQRKKSVFSWRIRKINGDEEDVFTNEPTERIVKRKLDIDLGHDVMRKKRKEVQELEDGDVLSSGGNLQPDKDPTAEKLSNTVEIFPSTDLTAIPTSTPLLYVSLFAPWDDTQKYKPAPQRPLPPWMSLVAAQRDVYSAPHQSSTPIKLPTPALLTNTAPSFNTQTRPPATTLSSPDPSTKLDSLPEFPERTRLHRTPTSYPVFQDSQTPITTTITSTSSTITPTNPPAVPPRSHSKGHLEKHAQPQPSPNAEEDNTATSNLETCPSCNVPLSTPFSPSNSAVVNANGKTYHAACFKCRICGASVVTTNSIFLNHRLYHIACLQSKAPALLELLRARQKQPQPQPQLQAGIHDLSSTTKKDGHGHGQGAMVQDGNNETQSRPSLRERVKHAITPFAALWSTPASSGRGHDLV